MPKARTLKDVFAGQVIESEYQGAPIRFVIREVVGGGFLVDMVNVDGVSATWGKRNVWMPHLGMVSATAFTEAMIKGEEPEPEETAG